MTDNEIIKGLECCGRESCNGCPYNKNCHKGNPMIGDAIDLIKRQQEEIERYERENNSKFDKWKLLDDRTKQRYAELYEEAKSVVRAEAIKEFAARLNDRIINFPSAYPVENATLAFLNGSSHRQLEILEIINNLKKEKIGEE